MKSTSLRIGLITVALGVANANAEDPSTMDGLALYKKECSVCHGGIAEAKTGLLSPVRPDFVQVAMADSAVTDWRDALGAHSAAYDHLAVAPIYGPPLRGVIGRPAASVKGYIYSKAFVEKMTGVTWDEAKLDKWMTSAQTMVPGSFMFVSIKNLDIRKKILDYLKEQTE